MNPAPDLTIVLLGNSGVGKSASGNMILGHKAFESKRSFKQVTTKISDPETKTVFGKRITVIDTPGIFGSEKDVQRCCQECSTPCLFLVVIKIDRFTIEQKNAIEAAIKVIGKDRLNHSYLLFTGGDMLDNELEDYISEDPDGDLGRYVEMFGGRHHVFNNKNGEEGQVEQLLIKSGHLEDGVATLPEIRIVLLGLPGSGKSASGNTILGSQKFKSEISFNTVSTQTVSESAVMDGRRVTVVDTPGFTGQVLSPKKLLVEIMKSIKVAWPGPHAIIIVVKIDRISEKDVKLYEMLPKLFDRNAHKYVMILFTYGDQLKDQTIDVLIQSHKCVQRLVTEFHRSYSVFDNTKRDRVQVKALLRQIEKMVTANSGEHYNTEMLAEENTERWNAILEWFRKMLNYLDCSCLTGGTVHSDDEDSFPLIDLSKKHE